MDAPVVTGHVNTHLKPAKQVLPEKFIEGSASTGHKRKIVFSKELLDKVMEDKGGEDMPSTYQSTPARFSSLRDLLASHSSSRAKVNKNKDK